MSSTPTDYATSTTSESAFAQGVRPSRKRTADDGNVFEVPFKQPRPAEPFGERILTPGNDDRHHLFSANHATDHSAFQHQPSDGVRLSLDSGVHELSANSDQQNRSADNYGFPPLAGDAAVLSRKRTLEEARGAARLSLDSGAQDLSGSSEYQNESSIATNVQPFGDVIDQAASEGTQAKDIKQPPVFKVLRALLVNDVPGVLSTSDQKDSSSDTTSIQPSADTLHGVASSHLADPAQIADFTTFTSPCTPVPKRDGPYKVYSRLQTMNNVKRYDVSVDELRRRASLPEGFNAAILNSYLRRPKAAENVRELRSELGANGLAVPNGRRHHKNLTAFSCLVEQEAKDLANDYDDLSKTFPYRPVGQKLARSLQGPHELASIQAAIQLLESSLVAISDAVKAESENPSMTNAAAGANKDIGQEDFSLLTHGFGLAAHRTAWTTLLQTLKAAASTLQQQMSSRMPPMMSMPSTSGFAQPPWAMPPLSPFYPYMGYMPRGNR